MSRLRQALAGMVRPLAAILTVVMIVACDAPTATDTQRPGNDVADPTELIECRQVLEDMCRDLALAMMRGPQPDYAEGAGVERVVVTCEVLPPCGAARLESGGKIMILYTNGWGWTQDWAPRAGT